ncbi:MAG: endonuclease/exonuclease/phosphatase family protein [Candidatus Marinimicrobia bacterium]|nr:endonuclease/exonuclease/phosphatase family protein [Candidatus Neomarinimicrobiota bacterium]
MMSQSNHLLILFIIVLISCEPLVTTFDDIEDAVLYEAKNVSSAPAPNGLLNVLTWNIRFGIGRLPFFGDSCGDRTVMTEKEVLDALELVAAKIDEINPDIILFQEVDRESKRTAYIDQVQWILDHTDMNYAAYASMWKAQTIPSDGIGRMDVGNVVMSRWEIESAERIQLALRTDQDALTQMFYLRRNVLKTKIAIPGQEQFYAVNVHATAFATDDTKQKHIDQFKEVLDEINASGYDFVAGGDLNSIPPGAEIDYCEADACTGEEFHTDTDGGPHKEGSYFNNFENEPTIMRPLYNSYNPAIVLEDAVTGEHSNTHSTSGDRLWDRKLDYIFTNQAIVSGTGTTHQDAMQLSDHAPVSVSIVLK